MRGFKVALPIAAVALVAAMVSTLASAAPSPRATLAGSVPPWASSSSFKSAADPNGDVGFRVYLGWRNADAAEALAKSVSDPSSASYGKYVSPGQFRQQFAPSQSDVGNVQSWLKSQGFSIVYTPTNNHYVSAEGTVAQVQTAFGVTLNEYAVDGLTLRAPSTDLTIPSSLASVVSGVLGIDESEALIQPNNVGTDAPPSSGFRNATPCSTYWGEKLATDKPQYNGQTEPYAPCGYTPAQLEGAYGVAGAIASGNDGSGVTVGIIDAYASPTILQDANQYSTLHGLPTLSNSQFTQVVSPGTYNRPNNRAQDPSGWYGEETLDVEAVHTMAPGAHIVFVGSPNNYQDMDAALNHVVDRHLADLVTNSYGFSTELLPPGYVKPTNDTFVQAAAEGIGMYFSSGDSGDEIANVGYRTVDWPASSPWVTAVGGTSLGVDASNGYQFETGWGTTRYSLSSDHTSWIKPRYMYGAGGGTSRLFAQPWYQAGVVPTSISGYFGGNGRAVPDVAAVADPTTGMLVGQTQTFSTGTQYDEYRIGGTSLASPLFAGVMALADQRAGHAHGFANPALYQAGASAYHDVSGDGPTYGAVRSDFVNGENAALGIRYTLRLMNTTGTLAVRPGYDDVTGLGSPNGTSFLTALGH